MNQIPYLRKFKKTIPCPRCTKKFEAGLDHCPHCHNVKDGRELNQLIEQHKEELLGSTELGKMFIIIAAIIGCLLILLQV